MGIKSPKDASGEFNFPIRNHDGKMLDMKYKSISEERREKLYLFKL